MARFVGAIDQGTTSTRFVLFDHGGRTVAADQREHRQITPRPGWVEHDPLEIWQATLATMQTALERADAAPRDVAAIGISNQRETTVLWDRESGRPLHNAIVWQDTRTAALVRELGGGSGPNRLRATTGLPLSTYFSGPKLTWLLENVPGARARAEGGELAFGTIDSWLAWNLTGRHVTDPGNASRTLLLDLRTLDWHEPSLALMGVPRALLPTIVPSSAVIADAAAGAAAGSRLSGILGDQQAALFGQACFAAGEAKCTHGTGSFLLVNAGTAPIFSDALLTSVGYRLGSGEIAYVLEGSIAVTGALVQWLRDRLHLISSAAEIEQLAGSVPDCGDVYFVPAFSGLFAPHWRDDARGTIVGLTAFAGAGHIARAALEAAGWQTREVLDAIQVAVAEPLSQLRVDGGMTANDLFMQIHADTLGIPVERAREPQTTALGAAFAAGLAVGFWNDLDELRERAGSERRFEPQLTDTERERGYARWREAVARSLGWS